MDSFFKVASERQKQLLRELEEEERLAEEKELKKAKENQKKKDKKKYDSPVLLLLSDVLADFRFLLSGSNNGRRTKNDFERKLNEKPLKLLLDKPKTHVSRKSVVETRRLA